MFATGGHKIIPSPGISWMTPVHLSGYWSLNLDGFTCLGIGVWMVSLFWFLSCCYDYLSLCQTQMIWVPDIGETHVILAVREEKKKK